MERYQDRHEAGEILATKLSHYAKRADVLVLGLARGGVPVAYEVAKALELPLDVFIVRKLGVPGQEELAFGAMASGGTAIFNEDIVQSLGLSKANMNEIMALEQTEISRRESAYRGNRAVPELAGKTVILIDDGIATGASIRAGIVALRQQNPAAIVVAVPVATMNSCQLIAELVDEFYCPLQPHLFNAVGEFYVDFSQTTDEEVQACLHLRK